MGKEKSFLVPMGEEVKVHYPDNAVTDALHTCLGIGILNTREKIGYLIHLVGWKKLDAKAFIEKVITENPQTNDLMVTLAGNIPLLLQNLNNDQTRWKEHIQWNQEQARWLMEFLFSKGLEKSQIQNCMSKKPGNYCFEMIVDTKKSDIRVKRHKTSD